MTGAGETTNAAANAETKVEKARGLIINIEQLLTIMSMLRDQQHGCSWDRKQTFQTIALHTVEEAYEVADAVEKGDYEHLPNELGDLLLQVVFYAQLGKEAGYFEFADIVREIAEKLLKRHPHVFPDGSVSSFGKAEKLTPEQVKENWERIKAEERSARSGSNKFASALDEMPGTLPAMSRARKLQERAAAVGFDWQDHQPVLAKVREELVELEEAMTDLSSADAKRELGDLLFSLINLSRHLKIDAEASLREANSKFETRFRKVEDKVREDRAEFSSLDLDALDEYWQEVKRAEQTD